MRKLRASLKTHLNLSKCLRSLQWDKLYKSLSSVHARQSIFEDKRGFEDIFCPFCKVSIRRNAETIRSVRDSIFFPLIFKSLFAICWPAGLTLNQYQPLVYVWELINAKISSSLYKQLTIMTTNFSGPFFNERKSENTGTFICSWGIISWSR